MCFATLQRRLAPLEAFSARYLFPLALLAARLKVAEAFLKSGRTKLDYILTGESDTLYALFADEYKVPYLPVKLAAWLGMSGELGLSALLALGLFARFGALGLIVMCGIIFHTDMNPLAAYWALICAIIATNGAGRFSLDALLFRRTI